MTDQPTIRPYSLKDAPALIERLLPVQKLSVESYKEQMAVLGKSLTALGSYWKGRKPLILNRACILASLLPATDDLAKDLEIFEMLMGDGPNKPVRPPEAESARRRGGQPGHEGHTRLLKASEEVDFIVDA